jgi:hypothetical protein
LPFVGIQAPDSTRDFGETFQEVTSTAIGPKRFLDAKTISSPHAKVHEGNFYQAGHYYAAVADDASADLLISTGANYNPHAVIIASVQGNCKAFLYEGVTTSDDGTSVTAYNSNRSSTNTSDPSFYHSPTVSNTGTQIGQGFIPGGEKSGAVGGGGSTEIRSGAEIILKKSTKYLVRITNISGSDAEISITMGFYEA